MTEVCAFCHPVSPLRPSALHRLCQLLEEKACAGAHPSLHGGVRDSYVLICHELVGVTSHPFKSVWTSALPELLSRNKSIVGPRRNNTAKEWSRIV